MLIQTVELASTVLFKVNGDAKIKNPLVQRAVQVPCNWVSEKSWPTAKQPTAIAAERRDA